MDKVFTFQRVKAEEIVRRIRGTQRDVKEVISRLDRNGPRRPSANGTTGDAKDEGPSEEDFILLEEDINDIIADVHDLAQFTRLNYTGFQKIIKKHDVCINLSIFGIARLTVGRNKPLGTSNLSSQHA